MNPSPIEVLANPAALNQFGWIATIDTLAGHDHTRWNAVMSVSFERTITKIMLNRERQEYQNRLHDAARQQQQNSR